MWKKSLLTLAILSGTALVSACGESPLAPAAEIHLMGAEGKKTTTTSQNDGKQTTTTTTKTNKKDGQVEELGGYVLGMD